MALIPRDPSVRKATMSSARTVMASGSLASPLAQLKLQVSLDTSSLASSSKTDPVVPPLDLNLFRTPSVNSIDSVATLDTHDHQDGAKPPRPESPTTPRAKLNQQNYFEPGPPVISPSKAQSGDLTPKKGFVVTSRRPLSPTSSQSAELHVHLRPIPGRIKDAPPSVQPSTTDPHADWTSVHGEQGDDWGEDEAQFEWLDTENAPEAVNGASKGRGGLSPSKRLSRMKAAVKPSLTVGGGEGKKLRKPLVFPRRAPPPPPAEAGSVPFRPLDGPARPMPQSPLAILHARPARILDTIPSRSAPPPPAEAGSSRPMPRSQSAILHPRPVRGAIPRSAPPPPAEAGSSRSLDGPARPMPQSQSAISHPRPARTLDTIPRGSSGQHLARPPSQRPSLSSRWTDGSSSRTPSPSHPSRSPPTMVPLKDDIDSLAIPRPRSLARNSQMSFQSIAYSFYDLEPDGCFPSSPATPTAREIVFPHGKYTKVLASSLEKDNKETRDRANSDPSPRRIPEVTEEDFVAKGIEARGKGDLARAAWWFMKAADGGSATGRMYWGLALRHGWGVARDDRRAYTELQRACEESLIEGGLDLHRSPGTIKLSAQQKKTMTKDLSLGMFEIANCFLEGVGVKRSPEVALAYLRFAGTLGDLTSQEQLGFLLSKGVSGIKKDMREAAKWYRMAIGQGSTNTFGLAWVWKDKYMD